MSQHDFDISTADANTGIAFRAAVNAALVALASNNLGTTAPGTTYGGQLWVDTTSLVLRMRNPANTGWYILFPLASHFAQGQLTDGATIAVDWHSATTQFVTLGGTGRTITFANGKGGMVYRLIIIQDATGGRTVTTWPAIQWAGGSAPTLTATPGKADVVTLLCAAGKYYGDICKGF